MGVDKVAADFILKKTEKKVNASKADMNNMTENIKENEININNQDLVLDKKEISINENIIDINNPDKLSNDKDIFKNVDFINDDTLIDKKDVICTNMPDKKNIET